MIAGRVINKPRPRHSSLSDAGIDKNLANRGRKHQLFDVCK
jgi:hypothetical protein